MIIVRDEYGTMHGIVLADAHTHLKVSTLEGLTSSEMIRRSSMSLRGVISDMKANPGEFRYVFPWEVNDKLIDSKEFCFKNFLGMARPCLTLKDTVSDHIAVDFFSSFSSDIPIEGKRDYRATNSQLKEMLSEKLEDGLPHNNPRFFPYGRVDPNHPDAIDTIDTIHMLGLRGLKLHPKEEKFEINSQGVIRILYRCAEHNLPVIFHTQDGSSNEVLAAVEEVASGMIKRGEVHLLPRLKVIVGHAPWNGCDNAELFKALTHPSIFGEISTLKGNEAWTFFRNAKGRIKYDKAYDFASFADANLKRVESAYFDRFRYARPSYWSSKIMFGTDMPYPPSNSAREVLASLFKKNFPGNISDIQNIASVSLLRLIPQRQVQAPERRDIQISYAERFHYGMLSKMFETHSRLVSVEPIIENFPVVRVNGIVVTFYGGGKYRSWMFNSLFDQVKPRFIVKEFGGYDDLDPSSIIEGISGEGETKRKT
jgi:predicted TIM-barrel fold metal-dependent hydrolase